MSDLRELYQEVIIDHGRNPRNYGALDNANYIKEGFNPLCGDKLTVYIEVGEGVVKNVHFEGCGCAISMASASLMTDALKGKTIDAATALFKDFHQLITAGDESTKERLGKLVVLAGVAEYPSRVKCATLAWHTAHAAMTHSKEAVSTE